jgi:hypothetical protein
MPTISLLPNPCRSLGLFLFCLVLNAHSWAQQAIPQANYDVSAQTKFLSDQLLRPQVNNSGTVDINIPLYTITCGKLTLPITLTYNTGGIKVSQRPSIVGLGWNLNCGGVITRIIRGNVDEYAPVSTLDIPDEIGGYDVYNGPIPHDLTYFTNHGLLNRSDWNASGFANAIQTSSGYTFSGDLNNPTGYPQAANIDLAPDEYDFYLTNGISGSFFMDHNGQWQVRSNQAVKIVEVDYGGMAVPPPNPTPIKQLSSPSSIYQIKLLDEEGNLYTFGHTTDNPAAIEFSRGVTGPAPINDFRGSLSTASTAWYLTQVQTPSNDVITLNYRYTFQFYTRLQSNETNISGSNVAYAGFVNRSLTTTPMIQSITTSQGVTINFTTNASTQLDNAVTFNDLGVSGPYGCTSTNSYNNGCFWGYRDIESGSATATMYELDEMQVSYQGALTNDYKFHYTSSASSRMHLLSFDFLGNGTAGEKQTYQFGYNTTSLPGYNSGMEDLLGYYNNSCFFCTFSGTPALSDLQNTYLPSRAPSSSWMAAESLISITNPYGGTVNYNTEPNDYSNFINAYSHSLSSTTATTTAGGLRVKQIVASPNDGNSSPRVTNFHYIQNWISNSSGPSSGILYDDISSEVLAISGSYFQCTHLIGSTRKYGEIPVTYSEITEEEPGNGYTVRKFSDYTTGQTDNAPYYITAGQVVGFNLAPYAYDDRKLTRGNPKSEQIYNSSHQLLREIDYNYQSDGNAPLNYVRTVQYLKDVINSSGTTYFSFVAFPQYYYLNTLTSKTVKDYDYSQNPATAKTMTETFTYDQFHQSKAINKQVVDSKGNTRSTVYIYPFNYANGTGSIYDAMVSQNIVGPAIDELHNISYVNGGTPVGLSQSHDQYLQWYNATGAFINPVQKFSTYGTSLNTSDYTQIDATFVNYDSHRNLLEYIPRNGTPVSYDYGYNGLYPTVKIVNAANSLMNTSSPAEQEQTTTLSFTNTSAQAVSFSTLGTGTITVTIHNPSMYCPTQSVNFTYLITPGNLTGHFGCSSPVTVNLGPLAAGSYTLQINPNATYSGTVAADVTYPNVVNVPGTSGIKEFFNENFEESTLSGVVTGVGHTGVKYFSGSYNVSFSPPNSRNYTIQWWNQVNGSWQFNEQPYTGPTTLSGTLDDIRVFPSDAQMSTYTYLPLVGIASELDPAGHCTTYAYDNLNRISLVLDKDKNIIKKICYDYAGQPMSCTGQ